MSLWPYMTWSLQSLEDSQLSCTTKLETVVRSDVGHLSIKARLKERKKKGFRSQIKPRSLVLVFITCSKALFEPSSDLCCENAGRQWNRSQKETVDLAKDGGIYRRQQEVQAPLHVDTAQHTWNIFPGFRPNLALWRKRSVEIRSRPEIESGSTFWLLQSVSHICIMYNYKKMNDFCYQRLWTYDFQDKK